MRKPQLIDAHCHLHEERIRQDLQKEIEAAQKVGVTGFISSALAKDEFIYIEDERFREKKFLWSAGIHPYYEKSKEADLELLAELLKQKKIVALGEIGLDRRGDNFNLQKRILLQQLELARDHDLPVIFHVVQDHYRLHKLLKKNFSRVRGYLHGFNASLEIAETFSRYDLAFSLGCRLPKTEVLNFVLKRGFLLFETDAPYQKPPGSEEEFNHLANIGWAVNDISERTDVSKNELLELQYNSFIELFGEIL